MRIELISTGDEVITGSIDDTNASFLSRELIEAGLQVDRRHTCGDSLEELMALFTEVSARKAVVIVTGGLGPTNDDLTTEAAARVAKVPLELNEQWLERMQEWFKQRGRTMAHSNIKQAMLPQGSLFINNPVGTACGFVLKIDQAIFIFAPGVPRELKAMWELSIKELILSFTQGTVPRTHLIRIFLLGIGESNLAERLAPIKLPQGITLGDRAIYPLIELKVIGHDASDTDMIATLNQIMNCVAPFYVCQESYSLLELLNQNEIKLAPCNAVDGLCRGWFLIHLQELCTNFISCTVLNTDESLLSNDDQAIDHQLLAQIPENNQITLLPADFDAQDQVTQDALRTSQDKLHHYLLSFNLDFVERDLLQHLEGKLLFGLKDNIYHSGAYTRNRDFLAYLCTIEIYKALRRESFIIPEECEFKVLALQDSRALDSVFPLDWSDLD